MLITMVGYQHSVRRFGIDSDAIPLLPRRAELGSECRLMLMGNAHHIDQDMASLSNVGIQIDGAICRIF